MTVTVRVFDTQVVMSHEGVLEEVARGAKFAAAKGVSGGQEQLWFNGALTPNAGANWRNAMYMALQGEMQTLQVTHASDDAKSWVYVGRLIYCTDQYFIV